jgi:hypothetical protein
VPVHPDHRRRDRPTGAGSGLDQLPGQLRSRQPVRHPGPRRSPTPRRRPRPQLVVLGDGAPWIWNLATAILPEATPIVDLYHAREHLHDLAAALAGVLGDDHPGWLADRLADLDAGDIETLVTETTRIPLADTEARERDKALAYFRTNAHRMRYAYFREHGMFVGSGTVEAGCKAIVGQRLKLSGMRWNIPGATAILTLRCQQASNRWDQIWTHMHNQTSTAATA